MHHNRLKSWCTTKQGESELGQRGWNKDDEAPEGKVSCKFCLRAKYNKETRPQRLSEGACRTWGDKLYTTGQEEITGKFIKRRRKEAKHKRESGQQELKERRAIWRKRTRLAKMVHSKASWRTQRDTELLLMYHSRQLPRVWELVLPQTITCALWKLWREHNLHYEPASGAGFGP